MKFNDSSFDILSKAFEVHTILGPGLLETTYQECLYYELINDGFNVQKELCLPLHYKNLDLEKAYRVDLLVNNTIVIEVKSVSSFAPVHEAQILTYMKLGGYKTGLLINFNTKSLRDGIKRFVF